MNAEDLIKPSLSHVEPVLAVKDVAATIRYWQEVLGFSNGWTWGEPADHGGVSWGSVYIQFSQNPELAAVSAGHSIWIRVKHVDKLYAFHQQKKAEIVSPLQNRPWGMAEYIIQDCNGYYISFSSPVQDRVKSESTLPSTVRIISRLPSPSEYKKLIKAVGWSTFEEEETVSALLNAAVYGVVAEDISTGDAIGCAFLISDLLSLYYVKDVMVDPAWQHKRVGSAMMYQLTNWLENNAPHNAFVTLITGENLSAFYQQFGFSAAFGMQRRISRKDQEKG